MINRIKNTQERPARLPRPCKFCGSIGHTAFNCPKRPRKPMQSITPMKRGKRLKPMGKIGKKLAAQSKEFIADYKPPYLCVYCLVIGYDNPLMPEEIDVEHGNSKRMHPDQRFAKANLYISCKFHNKDKSSMDIDKYIEKIEAGMAMEKSDGNADTLPNL